MKVLDSMHEKIVVAENGEDSLFRNKEKKSLEGFSDEVFAEKYLVLEQSSVNGFRGDLALPLRKRELSRRRLQ